LRAEQQAEANQADALPDPPQELEPEPEDPPLDQEEEQVPEINDPPAPGIMAEPPLANPAAGLAPGGPAAAATFALTPAAAHSDILDYTRREHMRVYESAVMPLAGDKFDGTAENLTNFLTRLREKAENFTWLTTVCRVQVAPGPPPVMRNLIDDYGNISIEQVRAHATPYVNQERRIWQNSHQMKVCVFDSLTKEFQNRVNLDKRLWHINDHPEGACLLKVVISLSYPDTQATTSHIRTELTKTDIKIKALNFDIIKFNDWTKDQLAALHARGETTTDLLVNLFKGYEAVPDKEFVLYIASKKSRYEEGKPLTAEELMEFAQNKFKNKQQAQTWNLPTEEQEQIIALEARIENLQTQNRNLAKRGQAVKGNTQGGRGQQQNRNRKPGGRGTKKNDRAAQKGRDGDYLNATGKWAWLKTAPKAGEKTSKTFDGKPFFWCPKHARWGRHGPAQCRKGQEAKKGGKPNDSQDANTPQIRFSNAYQALVDDDEEI
jgi:hypothetical protein